MNTKKSLFFTIALTTHNGFAWTEVAQESWVADMGAQTPYVALLQINTTGMVCKIVNGQKIYINNGKELPGTDSFIELNFKKKDQIDSAPEC